MAAMTFRQIEFFGGAMTAEIPEGFGDVSLLRPVPSHQEIYLSATGFTSLILEINERVEDLGSDQEALRYHFDDVVTPGDISHVWETSNVMQLPNFPSPTPTLCLLATASPPPAPPSSSQQEPGSTTTTSPQPDPTRPPRTSTAILLTLIRLRPQSTDLLLTINVPFRQPPQVPSREPSSSSTSHSSNQINGDHLPRPPQNEGINFQTFNYVPLVGEGLVIRDRLLQSLVVRDWSLFENDDG